MERKLLLFLDGTSNKFGHAETNVLKAYQTIAVDSNQVTYYQSGIGTVAVRDPYVRPSWGESTEEMATGSSVDHHIQLAYAWVCNTYKANDRIYILGFSRGAYVARGLAAMILAVGILDSGCTTLIPQAFAAYRGVPNDFFPHALDESVKRFQRSSYIIPRIHFLGLWDTVASIHAGPRTLLPGTEALCGVRYVSHAMSLDDDRKLFCPEPISPPPPRPVDGAHPLPLALSRYQKLHLWVERIKQRLFFKRTPSAIKTPYTMSEECYNLLKPDVSERWFAGTHGNVGGGAAPSQPTLLKSGLLYQPALSNIPLRWMLYELSFRDVRLSLSAIVGDVELVYEHNTIQAAPFYLHLRTITLNLNQELERDVNQELERDVNQELERDEKVRWAVRMGAYLDALSHPELLELSQDPNQALRVAAEAVLADIRAPIASTDWWYHFAGMDWTQLPVVRNYVKWRRDSTAQDSSTNVTHKVHQSVRTRYLDSGRNYVPDAHFQLATTGNDGATGVLRFVDSAGLYETYPNGTLQKIKQDVQRNAS